MAKGDVSLKRLFQGALSTVVTTRYTVPVGKQATIVEIWVDNQNTTTDRMINIFAHGTAATNRLCHNIPITKDSGIVISDNKIFLDAGQVLALSQNIGTDVVVTIYGVEEDIV